MGGTLSSLHRMFVCKTTLQNLDVSDLGYKGHKFIWSSGNLLKRLNRAYCNQQWYRAFPNSNLHHRPFILTSNHCPILLCLGEGRDKNRRNIGWMYEKWWMTLRFL